VSGAARRRRRDRPAVPLRPPEVEPTPERLRRGAVGGETVFVAEPGGDGRPRPQRVRRDATAAVRARLARFRDLAPAQLEAAERFERDLALARLEPRMVMALDAAARGGRWAGTAESQAEVLDARERVQRARQALRRGGGEVLTAVEAIVMSGAAADTLGGEVYAGKRDASVYVRTLLGIGLNLLAEAYGVAPAVRCASMSASASASACRR
jgi:hypothetical protein